jgi:aminoglycoside 3-N-acetyltransferase
MIHTGFRRLKPLFSTPLEVAEWAFSDPGRLVILPVFTGSAKDSMEFPPVFDVRSTPCWTGAVPEAARGVISPRFRTLHPTHSCLVQGPGALDLVESHLSSPTPCGPGSPMRTLADEGGQVLLLGCGLESMTLIHAAEEEAGVPYVLQNESLSWTLTDAEGRTRATVPSRLHSWDTPRDYPRLLPQLLERGIVSPLHSLGWLVQAGPLFGFLVNILRTDPSAVLSTSCT